MGSSVSRACQCFGSVISTDTVWGHGSSTSCWTISTSSTPYCFQRSRIHSARTRFRSDPARWGSSVRNRWNSRARSAEGSARNRRSRSRSAAADAGVNPNSPLVSAASAEPEPARGAWAPTTAVPATIATATHRVIVTSPEECISAPPSTMPSSSAGRIAHGTRFAGKAWIWPAALPISGAESAGFRLTFDPSQGILGSNGHQTHG